MDPSKNEYFGMTNEPTENAKNKWQMSRLLPVFLGSLPEVLVEAAPILKRLLFLICSM